MHTKQKCLKINEAKTGGTEEEIGKAAITAGGPSPRDYILTHEMTIKKFLMIEIICINFIIEILILN